MVRPLAELIPENMRSSSLVGLIQKAQEIHSDDYIKQAISYSLDKSTKKNSQGFKSFLGKCLDEGWSVGYKSTRQEEKQNRDRLFLESRRLMPDVLLIQDAGLGCLISAQVMQERGLKFGGRYQA